MEKKIIDKPHMVIKRDAFLEKAYKLFSEKGIDVVSMQDVATASTYGVATLYRYFRTKPALVIACAEWKWRLFIAENQHKISAQNVQSASARDRYTYFLDAFIDMYNNDRELLRFNQFFNIYIQSEKVDSEKLQPYQVLIQDVRAQFHLIFEKGQEDKTIRPDVSEEEMFSTTLHLMLAAVTRYAVGLVYKPEHDFDPVKEIVMLKNMFLEKYTLEG